MIRDKYSKLFGISKLEGYYKLLLDKPRENGLTIWTWSGKEVKAEYKRNKIDVKEEIKDDDDYFYGWSFMFGPAMEMLQASLIAYPILFSDGAYCTDNMLKGTMLSTVSLDANHNIILLTVSHFIGNEYVQT